MKEACTTDEPRFPYQPMGERISKIKDVNLYLKKSSSFLSSDFK